MAEIRSDANRDAGASSFVIHWSAVLAGAFVALGTWMFLLALGAAIQGNDPPGTWSAIYNLVAPIIALFVGGVVAGRSRLLSGRTDGLLHGAVIWGFTMAVGGLLNGVFGAVFANPGRTAATVPEGFLWAIAGSILGSLIAALLGASSVRSERRAGFVAREARHEA